MDATTKVKRSADMHAYQRRYTRWKARGKEGPEPVRPEWPDDEKRAAKRGRHRRPTES